MLKRFIPTFLFFIILVGFSAYAQKTPPVSELTDKQIQELMEHIESRGLSEGEVELMAKARGYSDSDIAIIKERINRQRTGISTKSVKAPNSVSREQLDELSDRIELEDRTEAKKDINKIFGKDIFNSHKVTFEPNLRIATPPDYVLGVDDELSVDISGYAVGNYNLKVSPEGTVKLENLAPIYVNGLTVSKAKEKIQQRLATRYAGLQNGSLNLELTLTKVKSIKVTLTGEVESPGTYTVSSLATLFNALYLSGGPTQVGSFRQIQLLRNNRVVHTADIYDFLTTGSLAGSVALQDRDVIFVPVAATLVDVEGEVRRPYRFELKSSESLNALTKYAGGYTEKAYTAQLKVTRNTPTEKEILTVNSDGFDNFLLKNGDKVEVGAILDRYQNRIEVLGAVFRPGEFSLENSPTVTALIQNAGGLREDAFRKRAFLKRKSENLDPVLIPLNLDSVLRGFDVHLKREDILIIKSITELRELRKVTISGRVNISGEYDFVDNMSLNDLVVLAGGLREGASGHRIEISRRINDLGSLEKNVEVFTVDINSDFTSEAGNIVLSPFDIVIVRELPNYQVQKMVKVTGEVYYPGVYSITNRTERISDLIERAGGIRAEGYVRGAKFYRNQRQVAVNIDDVLRSKTKAYNLFLQEGDSLYIPKENQTIRVSGQVLSPADIAYQEKLSFRDYITQAGGYTDSAFVRKVYVKYPNGHVDKTKSFLTAKIYPKVEKGMEIVVPVKNRQRMSKAEVISISSGMISLSAVLLTLFRLL
jgi:polysaccharide export outer membrane protein